MVYVIALFSAGLFFLLRVSVIPSILYSLFFKIFPLVSSHFANRESDAQRLCYFKLQI